MTSSAARHHTEQHDVEDVMSDDIVTNVDGRAVTADDESTSDGPAFADGGDTLELYVDDDPVSSWSSMRSSSRSSSRMRVTGRGR